MTTIIVTDENNEIDEHDFEPEIRTITIGRRSTNDVCIPNLSVSGSHAKISLSDTGSMIEDLSSTNGTYINGRLISRQLLNDGDDIVMGKVRITFLQPEVANRLNDSSDDAGLADDDMEDDEIPLTLAEKTRLNLPSNRKSTDGQAAPSRNSAIQAQVETPDINPDHSTDEQNEIGEIFKGDLDDDDFDPREYGYESTESDVVAPPKVNPKVVESRIEPKIESRIEREIEPEVETKTELFTEPNKVNTPAVKPVETERSGEESISAEQAKVNHILDKPLPISTAVIEIKNGAKSGQVLPIDKPVTTLGRPGIQIAAIMKKPEGYFLMHIESDDNVEPPRLNDHVIGDEPVLLHSGDDLNVAGIDVQFMQS